jgi:type VI secretion system protein VasI
MMRTFLAVFLTASSAAPAATEEISGWKVERSISRMDDSPAAMIMKQSRSEVQSTRTGASPGFIMIRCTEGETSVIFLTDKGLGLRPGTHGALLRLDKSPAVKGQVHAIFDGRAAGFSGADEVRPIASAIKLAVRIENPADASIDMDFDLTGIEDAIKPVREACNW